MFNVLVKLNCHSKSKILQRIAGNLLEKFYGCEIHCVEIDGSVLFAHHARGCTIVAAKICENVVIYQNVTIGSNMRYNKVVGEWENVGNPVIGKNVVIADGAKILGSIIIGEDSVIAAGAIVTKNVPAGSVVYGVNRFRPKDADYDLIFSKNMIAPEKIIAACRELIERFEREKNESRSGELKMLIEPATPSDFMEIVEVWEQSVRATHEFLSEADIQHFKPLILNEYLKAVELFLVRENGQILGFLGLSPGKIEMLFLRPEARGKGIGKLLTLFAIQEKVVTKVDVNEQNPQAVGFYGHMGFKLVSRSPLDPQGRPFPILSMELEKIT